MSSRTDEYRKWKKGQNAVNDSSAAGAPDRLSEYRAWKNAGLSNAVAEYERATASLREQNAERNKAQNFIDKYNALTEGYSSAADKSGGIDERITGADEKTVRDAKSMALLSRDLYLNRKAFAGYRKDAADLLKTLSDDEGYYREVFGDRYDEVAKQLKSLSETDAGSTEYSDAVKTANESALYYAGDNRKKEIYSNYGITDKSSAVEILSGLEKKKDNQGENGHIQPWKGVSAEDEQYLLRLARERLTKDEAEALVAPAEAAKKESADFENVILKHNGFIEFSGNSPVSIQGVDVSDEDRNTVRTVAKKYGTYKDDNGKTVSLSEDDIWRAIAVGDEYIFERIRENMDEGKRSADNTVFRDEYGYAENIYDALDRLTIGEKYSETLPGGTNYNESTASLYAEAGKAAEDRDAFDYLRGLYENQGLQGFDTVDSSYIEQLEQRYGINIVDAVKREGYSALDRLEKEIISRQDSAEEAFKAGTGYYYETAKSYADREADKAELAKKQAEWKRNAEGRAGVVNWLASVPVKIAGAIEGWADVLQYEFSGERGSENYRVTNVFDNTATALSSTLSGVADEQDREFWKSTLGDNILSAAAHTFVSGSASAIDSAAVMAASSALFGPVGGAMGQFIISSEAGASELFDQIANKGNSTENAIKYSAAVGIIEGLTEKWSFEQLVNKYLIKDITGQSFKKLLTTGLKNSFAQGLSEGSEEFFSYVGDAIADRIINGSRSERNAKIREYERTMSHDEAVKRVNIDMVGEALEQVAGGFAGGFFLGGVTNAGSVGVQAVNNRKLTTATGRMAVESQGTAGDLAENLKTKLNIDDKTFRELFGKDGKKLAGAKATIWNKGEYSGKVYRAAAKVVEKAGDVAVKNAAVAEIKTELTARGIAENEATGLAEDIYRSAYKDKKVSKSIKNNETAGAVLRELTEDTEEESPLKTRITESVWDAVQGLFDTEGETEDAATLSGDDAGTLPVTEEDLTTASDNDGGEMGDVQLSDGAKVIRYEEGLPVVEIDGKEVASDSIDFGNRDIKYLYNAGAEMTVDAANAMVRAYNIEKDSVNARSFADNFKLAYMLGEARANSKEAVAQYLKEGRLSISENAAEIAREMGSKARKESSRKASEKAVRNIKERGKGKVTYGTESAEKKATKEIKRVAEVLSRIGYNVEIVDDSYFEDGENAHGAYLWSDSTIQLNADTATMQESIMQTLSHEITHSIQAINPQGYEALCAFIESHLKEFDTLVEQRQKDYGIDYDEAYDEVIAYGCQDMLERSDVLREFAEKHEDVFRDMMEIFREFLDSLKKAIEALTGKGFRSAPEAEGMKAYYDELSGIYKNAVAGTFEKINEAANGTGDAAENEKATAEDRVKFSRKNAISFSNTSESNELIDKTMKKHKYIINHDVVYNVPSSVLSGKGRISEQISEYFDSIGNFANRQGMKPVELAQSGAKSTTFHGFGSDKLLAVGAIKDVIENGVEIDFQKNWKNRGYDTHVISGYGFLNGRESLVSVVVKEYPTQPKLNNKFDLHETIIIEADPHIMTETEDGTSVSESTSTKDNTTSSSESQDKTQKSRKMAERDAEYMTAVQSGDMETAQRLVDEAARAAGYQYHAFHGTNSREEKETWNPSTRTFDTEYKKFTVFRKSYDEQVAHFFSANYDNAGGYGSTVYDSYLKMDKPLVINCNGSYYNSINYNGMIKDTYEWSEWARKRGYDGVIFENVHDGVDYGAMQKATTDYAVFKSKQVKSADPVTYDDEGSIIPLSERFNEGKADIRYSRKTGRSTFKSTIKSREMAERDAEYLELAKKPEKNKNKLRKIVEDAATLSGDDAGTLPAMEEEETTSSGSDVGTLPVMEEEETTSSASDNDGGEMGDVQLSDGARVIRYEEGLPVVEIDGKEVSSDSIDFGDRDIQYLYNAGAEMTVDAANAMVRAYNIEKDSVNARSFADNFKLAYMLGEARANSKEAVAQYLKEGRLSISENAAEIAREMGAKSREESSREASEKAVRNIKERGKGKVTYGTESAKKKATKEIKRVAEVLSRIGYNVEIVDDSYFENGENAHGAYLWSDSTIQLNADTATMQESIMQTLSHEITHSIQAINPQGYEALCAFIESHLKEFDTLVEQRQKDYGIDYDEAYDEVIAYGCQDMLERSDVLREFAEKHEDIFRDMMNVFREFLDSLKKAIEALTGKGFRSAPEAEGMKAYYDELSGIYKNAVAGTFEKINEVANSTGDAAENKKAPAGERVQRSIKKTAKGTDYVVLDKEAFVNTDGTPMTQKEIYSSLVDSMIILSDGDTIKFSRTLPGGKGIYQELFKKFPNYKLNEKINIKAFNNKLNENIEELFSASKLNSKGQNPKSYHPDVISFDTRKVYLFDGQKAYELVLNIANCNDGSKIAYSKDFLTDAPESIIKEIKKAEGMGESQSTTAYNDNTTSTSKSQDKKQNSRKSENTEKPLSLIDALEMTATTENELKAIAQYRQDEQQLERLLEAERNGDETASVDIEVIEKELLNLRGTKVFSDLIARSEVRARNEFRKKFSEREAERNEKKLRTEEIHRVMKLKERLDRALTNPSTKNNIPEDLQKTYSDFAAGLKGTVTYDIQQRIDGVEEKLRRINVRILNATDPDVIARLNTSKEELEELREYYIEKKANDYHRMSELALAYERVKNDKEAGYLYDPEVDALLKNAAAIRKPLFKMTSDELYDVRIALTAFSKAVSDARKLIAAQIPGFDGATADELNKKAILEVESRRDNPAWLGKGDKHISSLMWKQLAPREVFRIIGNHTKNGVFEKIFQMFSEAQTKMLQIQTAATIMFEDKINTDDFRRLTSTKKEDLVGIGFLGKDGKPIKITRGFMLSVYMNSLHRDNADHMIIGGLTIPEMKKYYSGKKKAAFEKSIRTMGYSEELADAYDRLNKAETELEDVLAKKDGTKPEVIAEIRGLEKQIDSRKKEVGQIRLKSLNWMSELQRRIENLMTDWEKDYIKTCQKFFDEFSKDEINRVTMLLYGYKKATVEGYFPILTDRNFLHGNINELVTYDFSLENIGMLKDRVHSANPILLYDITDVVSLQIDRVSRYCGFMPAIRNYNKIMGYVNPNYKKSLGDVLDATYGGRAKEYMDTFLKDIQGVKLGNNGGAMTIIAGLLRGHTAAATLTLNPRVALAQAASYPTAAKVVGSKALLKALAKGGKNGMPISSADRELIAKWSPYLYYREQGYNSVDMGELTANQQWKRVSEKMRFLTGWINFFDSATVGRLWYAAQYYVEDHNPNLVKGSDEYYMETAKIFNRIVTETQPNYTTAERPEILRSPNELVKSLGMFMTQRLQNVTILYESAAQLAKYRSDLKRKLNGVTAADVEEAGRQFRSAVTSQLFANVTIVAMKFATDLLLSGLKSYRDDDDELTLQSISMKLLENFLDTVIGNLFLGSDLFAIGKAWIKGDTYYGMQFTGIQTLPDVIENTVNIVQKMIQGKNVSAKELWNAAEDLGNLGGGPVRNARQLIEALVNHGTSIVNKFKGYDESYWDTFRKDYNDTESKLYRYTLRGDTAGVGKLTAGMEEADVLDLYVTALKKYDDRIYTAVEQRLSGQAEAYSDTVDAIATSGFDAKYVKNAVSKVKGDVLSLATDAATAKESGDDDGYREARDKMIDMGFGQRFCDMLIDMSEPREAESASYKTLYEPRDMFFAFENGNMEDGQTVLNTLYADKLEENRAKGKEEDEAVKDSVQSMQDSLITLYKVPYISGDSTERARIENILSGLAVDGMYVFGRKKDYFASYDPEILEKLIEDEKEE